MLYGHRRDPGGYARVLMEFDVFVPDILRALTQEDLLIITADRGCDPAFRGTGHTRENVSLLVYNNVSATASTLGRRKSFADIAQSVADIFFPGRIEYGKTFFHDIVNVK